MTESRSPAAAAGAPDVSGSPPRRRWLRRVLWGVAILAVLLVAGVFALGRYLQGNVGAEHVAELVDDALRDATGGLYTASLEDIEWRLGGMSLRLQDLSVMLDREVLARRDAEGTTPRLLFQLQHATVDVTGVDPWSLLRGEGFRAFSLSIDQPLVQISGLEDVLGIDSARRRGSEAVQPESALPPSPPAAEPTESGAGAESEAPRLEIWSVRVNGAELESYRRETSAAPAAAAEETFAMFERFEGVDIEIDDLDLGEAPGDRPRLLFADDLSIDIAEYGYTWPNGLHEEVHGPISLSTSGGYVRVENFNVRPTFERRDRVGEDGAAPTRVELHIDEVAIEGLDFYQVLERQSFSAQEFRFAGASATVMMDPPVAAPDAEAGRGPGASVGAVTAPVTEQRPGALLTQVLGGLPAIAVQNLAIDDINMRLLVDREGDRWLENPRVLHETQQLELSLTGYRSGPGVEYDDSRPFFSDSASLSAARVVTTLPRQSYRLDMTDWRISDNPGLLSMTSLRVEPLLQRRDLEAAGEPLRDRYALEAAGLRMDEIDFGSLIEDVDIEVGSLSVASARIDVTGSSDEPGEARDLEAEPPGETPAQVLSRALLGAPNVHIAAVQLDGVDFERRIDRDAGGWLDSPRRDVALDNLHVHLDALRYDSETGYDVGRPLLADSGEIGFDSLRIALGDGFVDLSLTDVLLSSTDTTGTFGSIAIAPATDDAERLRQALLLGSVPRVEASELTFVGTPLADFITTGEVRLESLTLASVQAELLEAIDRRRVPAAATSGEAAAAAGDNTESVIDAIRALPIIRVGTLRLGDANYGRYVGPSDRDWRQLPEPTEAIRGLRIELDDLDTDPAAGERRLLFSDRVVVGLDEMLLGLAGAGASLRLSELALSSDSDTLTIGGGAYSTRESGGNNDFNVGRIELTNVPYGRTFKALIEPRTTDTPVLSAMIDRGTDLRIEGVDASLDDARRALRVGEIVGSARSGDLSIAGVDLRPTLPDADPSTPNTEYHQEQTLLSFADVRLTGVDFPRLASAGEFVAASLEVDTPSVVLVTGLPSDAAAADASTSAPVAGTADATVLSERIADGIDGLPPVRIERIRLDGIEFEERRSLEGRPVRDFEQIQLAIDGLDLRHDRDPASPDGVLYSDDIRIDVPPQKTWIDNVGYEIAAGPISISTGAGTVDLGGVDYLPPTTREQYLARTRVIEGDRMEFRFGRVGLSGIDFPRLLREEGLYASGMTIADWSVDILHDKKKPPNPRSQPGPESYPHDAVQKLGLRFGIDRVDLSGGSVRYSERDADGDMPGELWWDRLAGSITNLSNDPERSSTQTPTVLAVEARMLDQAYLKLTWNLPLLEPGPTMSYSAEVGPLDVTRLSSILEPLEGVRISDGVFDRTWFDIDIRDRHATGTFNALYHDVKIQLVDRNTGGRNLGQRILSFAANLILPSNNTNASGEPERVGLIDWEVPDDKPFFGVFWDAVKQGVIDVAR